MKTQALTLALLAALLFAPCARADKTSTVLLNAVTVTGASSTISAATSPAETGMESYFFQSHATGSAVARVEFSADSGTTWVPLHTFVTPDDTFVFPACGACVLRANVTKAPAGSAVTVLVVQSGIIVPVVSP